MYDADNLNKIPVYFFAGDKSDSIYFVDIDEDRRRQQGEMDKKKREGKNKADKGQRLQTKSDYLHNSEMTGIKRGGEVEEMPEQRNSNKNKGTRKQQEVVEEEEWEKKKIKQENNQEDEQSKKMKRKNATDSM